MINYKPLVIVGIVSALCLSPVEGKQNGSRTSSRGKLLNELKKCEHPGPPYNCDEMTVYKVFQLYRRGDNSVLNNLMDVAPHSDGALAEALGDVFGEILCSKPRTFLSAVAKRPRKEHEELLFLATVGDGGGMGCRQIAALRRRLKSISARRNDQLSGVARECLIQLDKNNGGD